MRCVISFQPATITIISDTIKIYSEVCKELAIYTVRQLTVCFILSQSLPGHKSLLRAIAVCEICNDNRENIVEKNEDL